MAGGRGVILAAAPSPLWYLSRGTGAVTLVLLTATVVLGIAGTLRWRPAAGLPRFLVDGLHRNLSLLVVALLAAHVLTAVLDPFAHLRALDAVVPLASTYRPLWLGLGALALDLLIALVVTSLVRARLGLRAWRAVHWVAYACWPVALLHGLGTGTDASAPWLQALAALCVAAVAAAVTTRLVRSRGSSIALRAGGLGALAATLAAGTAFAVQGPMHPGWARRAGTPVALLGSSSGTRSDAAARHGSATTNRVTLPFTAALAGSARERRIPTGAELRILARIAVPGAPLHLDMRLLGRPLGGGTLEMHSSRVTLRPDGARSSYRGQIVTLNGGRLEARLTAPGARPIRLRMALRIDASGAVAGTAGGQELVG
jgi:methionine sulfoxide reductase heme-binding subunit